MKVFLTMIGLNSVTFDSKHYKLLGGDKDRVWQTPDKDQLDLRYYPRRPDISSPLDDVDSIRMVYREAMTGMGLAIIEVDVVVVDSIKALKTIVKKPLQPTGMTYIASLTIPFNDFSFVFALHGKELGITGRRDSTILMQMMSEGEIPRDDSIMTSAGWFRDPYDPQLKTPLMMNLSEAAEYDAMFQDHPLSRARHTQAHLVRTIKFDKEVKRSPAFEFKL